MLNYGQDHYCKFHIIKEVTMNHYGLRCASVTRLGVVVLTAFWAASAYAFFDGDFSIGRRSGSFEQGSQSKTLNSTVTSLGAHLDPIPLIPVSFGLRFYSENYNASLADHGVKSLTSTAIVPEITAWFPFGDLAPFARIGYTAISTYSGTAEVSIAGTATSGSVAYKSTGSRLTVGVNYSVLPLISILAAYERSMETLSMSEGKIGSVDLKESSSDIKFNSNALMLGVKAGI
jgi:hypothetical protein